MSIVFPQPMGELIRACSCSFLVKQEPFHCINIKSRDSSSDFESELDNNIIVLMCTTH